MRRRPAAAAATTVPELLGGPAVVEDWVSPSEVAAHTFAAACPVVDGHTSCAGDCDFRLRWLAHRRHSDAQAAWLAEQGPGARRADYRLPTGWPRWPTRDAGTHMGGVA